MSNNVSTVFDLSVNEQAFGVFYPYDGVLVAGLTKEDAERDLAHALWGEARGFQESKGVRLVYGGFVDADLA